MSNIDESTGLQTYQPWTGTAGTNTGDTIYSAGDVSDYDTTVIECTVGTITVDVSVDGVHWIVGIAARSLKSTTPTTFVTSIAAGGAIEVIGFYSGLLVKQSGATPSNARGAHAMAGRTGGLF